MDVLSPNGMETLKQEQEALSLFRKQNPSYDFVETPKDRPSDIDGFITRSGTLISGVEVKCRMMTMEDLFKRYDSRWLITLDKVERGIAVCRSLCVDFRGFLYLVPEKALFVVKIWDHAKGMVCDMDVEESRTQATVNGGSIVRLNAYLNTRDAVMISGAQ